VLCGNLLKEVLTLREVGIVRPAAVTDNMAIPVPEPIGAPSATVVPPPVPTLPARVSSD
jgi:hypothetical protein